MAKASNLSTPSNDDRAKSLAAALAQIEKQFGKGAVMKMDSSVSNKVDVIPSGCLALDIATGIGGLPRGRVVEIYGPESSGKTTLTLSVIAEAQKMGLTCGFIDVENALDPTYAEKLGVNINQLLLSQPDTGEQALEITDMLIRSNAVDVIIVDSVAALVPKAEIEGEMGDSHVGLQARMMSQALRKITGATKQSNCLVIFINQLRMKIGVMFGNPETTTGGNALKFYASMRLDIRRTGAVKKGEDILGNETRIKVVKNKLAPPFKEANTQLMYGEGFSLGFDILRLGVEQELIQKAGAWFSYKGSKLGQGEVNSIQYLKEHPELQKELYDSICQKLLDFSQVTPDNEVDTTQDIPDED
jgi:recombination protein RecA